MSDNKKRIIIAAGGTGGHVFPGLVIAEEFKKLGIGVIWIGTQYGIEDKLLPEYSFAFHTIPIRGIRGSFLGKLLLPFRLIVSILKSIKLISHYQVCGILGMGGYPAFPVGIAAWLTRKPLIIHEQNSLPGLVNKVLVNFANLSLTAYPDVFNSKKYISYQVGNPVRSVIYDIPEKHEINSSHIKLLIIGGSQGATFFNTVLPEVFMQLSNKTTLEIIHQTGKHNQQAVQLLYNKVGLKVTCQSFIKKMDQAYAWSDLVIARAGALTLSELMAAGRASILIPFPTAADDHQTKNAIFLVKKQAALLWQQKDFCPTIWAKELKTLLEDTNKIISMGRCAKALGRVDATDTIIHYCMEKYFG